MQKQISLSVFVLAIIRAKSDGVRNDVVKSFCDEKIDENGQWRTAFFDDFDYPDGLLIHSTNRNWTIHHEEQAISFYTNTTGSNSNVAIRDKKLVLTTKKVCTNRSLTTLDQCPDDWEITSGAVDSQQSQHYFTGHTRVCINAKLPQGNGMWPAHWLAAEGGTRAEYGEIDIMEMINGDGQVHGAYHWQPKNNPSPPNNFTDYQMSSWQNVTDYHDEYHEFAVCEWIFVCFPIFFKL